jgi:hypothetical protein
MLHASPRIPIFKTLYTSLLKMRGAVCLKKGAIEIIEGINIYRTVLQGEVVLSREETP